MSAGLLGLGAILMVILAGAGRSYPERLESTSFVRAANSRCARADQELVNPGGSRSGKPEEATDARRVQSVADGWGAVGSDLRRIPVPSADRARVDRWLRAWERWTALEHEQARALRRDEAALARDTLQRARGAKQEVNRFAYINGINACLLP